MLVLDQRFGKLFEASTNEVSSCVTFFAMIPLFSVEMGITNEPEVSKSTALVYGILFVFVVAIAVFFLYAGFFTPMGFVVGIAASAVSAFVSLIMLLILVLFQF